MQRDAQSRVWLCNRSEVATHFDLSDNIAVVALGRRRFTLFPPTATADLYVGPFNNTLPAGQPVSMPRPGRRTSLPIRASRRRSNRRCRPSSAG